MDINIEQEKLITKRIEVLNLKKKIILLKYQLKNTPAENTKSDLNEISKQLKEKNKNYLNDYKNYLNALKQANLSDIDYICYAHLIKIRDFSLANVKNEQTKFKQAKRNYTKYDNKPRPTKEDILARKLAYEEYKVVKADYKWLVKIAIKIATNNYKEKLSNLTGSKKENGEQIIALKEDLRSFKCLNKVNDNLIYFGDKLKNRITKEHLLFGRDIITIFSVISLAFSLYYIRAIRQVTNSITGLFMFMFILFGLISIFNAIRLKEATSNKYFFMLFVLLLTIASGLALVILCLTGIQRGVKVNLVYQGVILAIIVCLGYLIGLLLITKSRIMEKKSLKKGM